MNLAQRIVLILGFLIILGMALFPPWVFVYNYHGAGPSVRAERPAGYRSIFNQHFPTDRAYLSALFGINSESGRAGLQFFSLSIDRTRLAIQIAVAVILTAILYLAIRSRPATH